MIMEGSRRISANPRPCSGRRVLANKKRPRLDGFLNTVKKLQRREICSKRDRAFSMSNAQERFRNMRLMVIPPPHPFPFFIFLEFCSLPFPFSLSSNCLFCFNFFHSSCKSWSLLP
uniref:Uncharacterized protein LOC103501498 n=1 Tax=Rhizophora mucronata TaxID=61149 RepID=A0A2P2M0M8_RHIMU